MGLDWIPEGKAMPGYEDELDSIRQSFSAASGDDRKKLIERFHEITVPVYASLGAPVIGRDEVANGWFLESFRANEESPASALPAHLPRDEKERQALQDSAGYYVLELLPICDGFPVYSHAYLFSGLDRTSFRASFLDDCVEIIGQDLLNRAYAHMGPKELVSYGQALLDIARTYSSKHKCADLEYLREPPETDPMTPASQAHILFSAAKWCLYWGNRGHGLVPDW